MILPNLVQNTRFRELLKKYRGIFPSENGRPGRSNAVTHNIDTGGARPIRQTASRLPHTNRTKARKVIQQMQKECVTEPSNGPCASSLVLVKIKDGITRFCVDYRLLNCLAKKDRYPLPLIDDILDALAGSRIF